MSKRLEQLGPYEYLHEPGCFPLGRDSLELGAFATVKSGWRVCDLGCGGGVLLLLLAGRAAKLELGGVECSGPAAAAARVNLARNGLVGEIWNRDLRDDFLSGGTWDLVVSNPPYFPQGSGYSGGGMRMEESCTLDELCASAARLLKNGGRFALVHRPERLAELMTGLRTHRLEPKRMCLVQHDETHPPSMVLLEAVKNGKPGLHSLPTRFVGVSKNSQMEKIL